MAPLPEQFKQAKKNIEPSPEDKDEAPVRHIEVREEVLEKSERLDGYGIDTILIGSYARRVSIKRMKDVDVFCRLRDINDVAPGIASDTLLDQFGEDLIDAFGDDRVREQDRSYQISFPGSDMYVDVVPARPCGDHWEIPDGDGGWIETNPEQLGCLASKMNDVHGDHYIPTVKLVRQTRRAHLGDQPGGLYFEILTYHAFASGAVTGANTAEYFCTALEAIVDQLDGVVVTGELADPTLPGEVITTRASNAEIVKARDVFTTLASKARKALDETDPCASAKLWREVLGRNDDHEDDGGYVFPLPDGCDESGRAVAGIAPIRAGQPTVGGRDKRFA